MPSGEPTPPTNPTVVDITVKIIQPIGYTKKIQPKLQSKSANLTTAIQTIKADSGYDGLSQVTIPAVHPGGSKAGYYYDTGTTINTSGSTASTSGTGTFKCTVNYNDVVLRTSGKYIYSNVAGLYYTTSADVNSVNLLSMPSKSISASTMLTYLKNTGIDKDIVEICKANGYTSFSGTIRIGRTGDNTCFVKPVSYQYGYQTINVNVSGNVTSGMTSASSGSFSSNTTNYARYSSLEQKMIIFVAYVSITMS